MRGSAVAPGETAPYRLVAWLLLALGWFATMGWRPLLEPDEGRYAEIPREMTVTGDWVTPRLNTLKYFEKPPLQYWATAVAYSVFGVSEGASRLWSCALAFLCLPLTYVFARHLYGSTSAASAAATALALNPYFAIIGQLNLLDSALAFFLTASMFAYLRAGSSEPGSTDERRWMALTAVALALAVLSKGIVALGLAGVTFVLHFIVTRDLRPLRRWHLLLTVPLFLIVAVPWFVLVSLRNPEFAGFFFVHEHFARYLTDVSDRVQPWWYFLPLLLLALLPWLGAARDALTTLARADRRDPAVATRWFLWIWCAFILVFFSISHSKLATYLLPMMPALAVLLAPHIAAHAKRVRVAAGVVCGVVVLVAIALLVAASRKSVLAWDGLTYLAAFAVLVAALGVLLSRRAVMLAAIASVVGFQALIVSYTLLPPVRTARGLVADSRPFIGPQTVLFSVDQYRQSIPPYLARTLRMVLYQGELEFGLTQEPERFVPTLAAFVTEWRKLEDAVAFLDPEILPQLREQNVPLRVVAHDDRTIVIARN